MVRRWVSDKVSEVCPVLYLCDLAPIAKRRYSGSLRHVLLRRNTHYVLESACFNVAGVAYAQIVEDYLAHV